MKKCLVLRLDVRGIIQPLSLPENPTIFLNKIVIDFNVIDLIMIGNDEVLNNTPRVNSEDIPRQLTPQKCYTSN